MILISLLLGATALQPLHTWEYNQDTHPDRLFAEDKYGGGLICGDDLSAIEIETDSLRPKEAFTISAWVAIEEPLRWGGIIGCVQDNAETEYGWVLGYNQSQFTFGLSTEGADDGDGHMTYLDSGKAAYQHGKWHHVVASYDGSTLALYVDGVLCNSTNAQSGNIAYSEQSTFVIGAYKDDNEEQLLDGRLIEVGMSHNASTASEVQAAFEKKRTLTTLPSWTDTTLDWKVAPYLNWPTTTSMVVSFETTVPTTANVTVTSEDGKDTQHVLQTDTANLHHFQLHDLQPNAKYFYAITATDTNGIALQSETLSFRTAPEENDSFTFIAIGDTQSQADVVKRVSDLAYMHRPNLVVHAGDLVSTGTVKSDWTKHFFPAMQPLIGRVPLMPVLGNHEQDAQHYYDYMVLPHPEMYYSFTFGNAEFFMIDGNRNLEEGSEQLAWLESALKKSSSLWKFAVLHQPPYTSDSNDYGDTHATTSTRGDTNVQHIIELLELYNVDICFSGHVHDYERTFPILDDHVVPVEDGGVVYVTTAGGGGHLEDFDPTNTWFGHKKANYHHLVYIAIHGKHLEFQAIDEHGQLFDVAGWSK